MRLVYKREKGNPNPPVPVRIGDLVPIGDDVATVMYAPKPHKPDSEGKVTVQMGPGPNGEDGGTREYYVSVIGAEWIEREDRL